MTHAPNLPRYGQFGARRHEVRTRRIDSTRTWTRARVNVSELLKSETVVNHNRHPDDLTRVAWTKTGLIATRYMVDDAGEASASILTAIAPGGTCTQTISRARARRAFSADVRRVKGVGAIEMTTDGVTWLNVTLKVNGAAFALVYTGFRTLACPTIGFRLGTAGDEIAVQHARSVELED